MSKIAYQNITVTMPRTDVGGKVYIAPASNVTISHSAKLNRGLSLAANSLPQMRLAGAFETKLTINFPICNKLLNGDSFNFGSGVLRDMTGTTSKDIQIGGRVFSGCYLDQCSISLAPFQAATMSANFTCTNPPTGLTFISGQEAPSSDLSDSFAYGHFAQIDGASNFSAPIHSSMSYSLDFRRAYSYALGSKLPTSVFLDEVNKKLSMQSTNINNFINESGAFSTIAVNLYNQSGALVLPLNTISVSNNARLNAQNLTAEAGTILKADLTIDESIL
jgi:hypothetical protein